MISKREEESDSSIRKEKKKQKKLVLHTDVTNNSPFGGPLNSCFFLPFYLVNYLKPQIKEISSDTSLTLQSRS
jgi:hypothetical protein